MIDDIPENNFRALSTSSLSNVSIASRLDMKSGWSNEFYSNDYRALAMGRSLEETFAFSGVHHIFDHHKGSGISLICKYFDLLISILFSGTCAICPEWSKSTGNLWSWWDRCDLSSTTNSSNYYLSSKRSYSSNQWSVLHSPSESIHISYVF